MERETLEYDVVIVGGGPSGLSAACRLKQLAQQQLRDISVCLVEKAAQIGAHSVSGAVLQTTVLDELFPDWQQRGAPLQVPVTEDEIHYLFSSRHSLRLPALLAQRVIDNHGNYVISLGQFCRWLAQQAEALGVEIYPGFAASDLLIDEHNVVRGIRTGDMGLDRKGEAKSGFTLGVDIRAKYTLFAEGCRGHLGKQLIQRYQLDRDSGVQHYAIGIKEAWEIDPAHFRPGKVVHAFGWPLAASGAGAVVFSITSNTTGCCWA